MDGTDQTPKSVIFALTDFQLFLIAKRNQNLIQKSESDLMIRKLVHTKLCFCVQEDNNNFEDMKNKVKNLSQKYSKSVYRKINA